MAERTDELKRALLAIRDLRRQVQQLESGAREPIAIVGAACRLPGGADTPEAFWELLRGGVDATSETPSDRWDVEALYDPDPDAPGKLYTRRGGFLSEPVDRFDAEFFGISPREAAAMDPIQRLLLELSWEALERAGTSPRTLSGSRTGVFVGVSGSDYDTLQHEAESLEDIDSYRGTGSAPCVTGGRISYVLGLQGPNVSVDTACSSSLTAVALAVEGLRAGTCDMAIAGGAHLMLAAESTVYLCRMRALSPGGRCRTFDEAADGYARGEGGVVFVLKRLSRALAAGDPIMAVIRGVAVNHDGRSSGLTVPNPAAQRAVIQAALANGDLQPTDIAYVEAHGTATPLGDPIEVRALAEVLGRGRTADRPLLIGSCKSNFGHLEAAAGAAGLLKLVLSLQHEELPPHLNCENPTSHVDWDRIPVRVNRELRAWPDGDTGPAAGVSAFGFSGTNAHVIVERAPAPAEAVAAAAHPAELVVISGLTPAAARDAARAWAASLASPGAVLPDLALTALIGRSHFGARAYAVGATREELREQLDAIASGEGTHALESAEPGGPGRIAFLFTGQGSQFPGMGKELMEASPLVRGVLERCDEILRPHLDRSLIELISTEQDPELLQRTEYAQPALFALEYALATLWRSWGIEPSYLVGHSLGEYVAATVAGVMTLEDALPLVALRGRLMGGLPAGGAMAAVLAPEAIVAQALRSEPSLSVAAYNAPENVVVSGDEAAVERLVDSLAADGVQCKRLHVSHAFHSAHMDPVLDRFEAAVAAVRLSPPTIPVVSNLTGRLMTDEEATDPARWRRHLREPVRFAASISELRRLGTETFLEVGPHPSLTAMASASIADGEVVWLASMRRGRGGWAQILETVGELWRRGADLDLAAFAADHGGRRTVAPTYPFQRERHWFTDHRPQRPSAPSARGAGDEDRLHPLLGKQIRSPAIAGWVFETTLSPEVVPYLADHRVGGQVVVPGAASVEMLLQAGRHGPGWAGVELRGVAFERPLVLDSGAPTLCQVILGVPEGGEVAGRIVTLDAAGEWQTVARARLAPLDATTAPTLALAAGGPEEGPAIPVDELYAQLEGRGIQYGPAFRTLVDARRANGRASGALEMADAVDDPRYLVHPCLLDGALHLLAAVAQRGDDPSVTYLPSGIDAVRVTGPLGATARVYVQARPAGPENHRFSADVLLLSADGSVVAELQGFQAAEVRGLGRSRSQLHLTSHDVDAELAGVPVSGTWGVVGPDGELMDTVAAALRKAGAARVVSGASAADLAGDEQVGLDGLVLLPAAEGVDDTVAVAMGEHFERLLGVVRSGALRRGGRLVVVARPPEGTTPRGEPSIAAAAATGLHGSLRAEHEELQLSQLVLDADGVDVDRIAQALTVDPAEEDRIAVSPGGLTAPRLLAGESPPADDRTPARVMADNYHLVAEPRGTLDALSYRPCERPAPGPGEVEVRVRYTGLNFRDVLNVLQAYAVEFGEPGLEVAGIVTRVGEGVTTVSAGDAVIGLGSGLFGAYVTLRAKAVVRVPENLTDAEAATIPLAFLSAEWGLRRIAALRPGERVLIHAAAGGVGQAAVQIALACGAQVFATAGSDAKRRLLRAQGIEHVFDSRSAEFADGILAATGGDGVDVVLNSLTGDLLRRSLELLRPGGRFVELGLAELLSPEEVSSRYPGIRYESFQMGALPISDDEFHAMFVDVVDRFSRGELRPLRHRVFGPAAIGEAFHHMAQARHTGKVLVGSAQVAPAALDPRGSYLVTGGGGGVGRALAAWLVESGAGRVVLNGRTPPDDELRAWMESLREGGSEVEWVSADVGDAGQARAAVGAADQTDRPLRGIFHAAGVVDDGLLATYDRARFDRVVAGKVAGAVNLHRASSGSLLDHFVLFSSTAALIGGPGQAAYGAANAALGALAAWRADHGLPALCVHWGAWGEAGMAARLSERERQLLEMQGLDMMASAEALEELRGLMASGAAEGIVAKIRWERVRETVRGRPMPLLRTLLGDPSADGGEPHRESGDGVAGVDPARLAELPLEQRQEQLAAYLLSRVATVLRMRPDRVTMTTRMAQLGFDSLMAVELRNRIESDLGVVVPVADLLRSDTPGDIAAVVESLFAGAAGADATTPHPAEAAAIETFEF